MPLHGYFASPTYTDITPWVKFGQANTLTLMTASAAASWKPGPLEIKEITLQRVENR